LVGSALAASPLRAQTTPATGPPIKAVPQTERKLRPPRVEELTPDQLREASEGPEADVPPVERSARGPRTARPPRGPRGGPPIRARVQPRS
jgi:hypothetical protein